jgi:hypothetical protein
VTAGFTVASQTLSQPGTATFFLLVHNTGNSEDEYSASIIGANGPVTASLVGLDGSPTQSIPIFRLPGLSTGAIELEANLAAIGSGTVTIQVQSLTDPAIVTTATATVMIPRAVTQPVTTDGPEVMKVKRYGYHWMPTTIVVTFNEALNPAAAVDRKDYRIFGPAGRRIRVKRAVYDPATFTVILHPARRINIHHKYKFIIEGTGPGGLKNTAGQLLDGTASGHPGSNFKTALTWRNLVLDPPPHERLHQSNARVAKPKIDTADKAASHHKFPFTRPPAFRR